MSLALALRDLGTAKQAARMADVSHRTMERWQRGESQPPGPVLIALMGRSAAFAQAVLRQAGLTDLLMDIEEARMVAALAEHRARRLKGSAHDQASVAAARGAADGPVSRVANRA